MYLFRERGVFYNEEDLEGIIISKFSNTVACVGIPCLKAENSLIEVTFNFFVLS